MWPACVAASPRWRLQRPRPVRTPSPTPRPLSRKYAGPQTTWEGPTAAPKPEQRQEDRLPFRRRAERHLASLRRLHQGGRREARLEGHCHRRQGQPDVLARRHEPGDRAQAGRHRDVRRCRQPEGSDQGRRGAGHQVRRPSCRGLPGPQPDLNLFVNIQEDPREIGKAEADWAIADSDGKAGSSSSATMNMRSPKSNRWRPRPRSRSARAARCWTTSTRRRRKPPSGSRS